MDVENEIVTVIPEAEQRDDTKFNGNGHSSKTKLYQASKSKLNNGTPARIASKAAYLMITLHSSVQNIDSDCIGVLGCMYGLHGWIVDVAFEVVHCIHRGQSNGLVGL